MDSEEVALAAAANGSVVPKPSSSELEQELGVPGPISIGEWWLGQSGTEKVALSTQLVSLDKLVEMRQRDGQARALMRLFQLPVRAALKESEWIAPPDVAKGEATKEVDFANNCFRLPPARGGMSVSIAKFMRQTLLAIVEGFSAFEEVWMIPKVGPNKGLIVPKKLAHRDSRTVQFFTDDHGGFNGFRQVTNMGGKVVDVRIPTVKAWYYAVNEEENPFYGVSYFEAAWHHWDIKRKLYYIAHLGAQFAAVPGRIGTFPANADTQRVSNFRKALESFALNTAMTKPTGYEVEPFNGNSQFNFMALIDHHNAMMSKSVLAKFLDDEQTTTLIDNGGQDATTDLFMMALEGLMQEIAESLTIYFMPKFIDWNFGTGVYPQFKFGSLGDPARDIIKEMLMGVATAAQTQYTPEFVREMEKKMALRLGLDIDYEEVDKREQEELKQQQEQQQMMFESQFGGGGGGPQGAEGGGGIGGGGGAGGASGGGGGFPGGQGARGRPQPVAASGTGGAYVTLAQVVEEMNRQEAERNADDGEGS